MTLRVSIVFAVGIIIMIVFSVFLPFIYLFRMLNWQKADNLLVTSSAFFWARITLFLNGIRFDVYGKENIPKHNNICLVSNHQSNFDIPLILGNIPKVIGFISKIELSRVPIFNLWMFVIRCPFIDRKNREKSLDIIEKRLQKTTKGQPMLIFPEGKRSKKQEMNNFKKGGITSIIKANTIILPITVYNTHKICKGSNIKLSSFRSKLIIHKEILPSELAASPDEIIKKLENIINPLNQD